MLQTYKQRLLLALQQLFAVPDDVSPARYKSLRRIMVCCMVAVAVAPLLILTGISHTQYMATIAREMENPLYALVRKSQASLELFLGERASTVSFIAHAHTFQELTQGPTLIRVFKALKSEFKGFIDMGLVDGEGRQVAYVGPYALKDADYSGQPWLQEAQVKGRYISDVFLGLRGIPHMVIAVHRMEENGKTWTLRVTIDTAQLEAIVASVGLMQDTDAFVCDSNGVLQTNSRFYGKALEKLTLAVPPKTPETTIRHIPRSDNNPPLVMAYTSLAGTNLMLVGIKPAPDLLRPWTNLQSDLLLVLCGGIAIVVLVSYVLIRHLVGRLEASDERRVAAFAQMEHSQKLSSIGRLAAGVAHEVNNPLAVINEKTGLAKDILQLGSDFDNKQKILELLEGVESTVERARSITRRLLGFSRRMEAQQEELRIEDVLNETLSFLERGAKMRNIAITMESTGNVPAILSDRGQLQQVFLNLIGNALEAVDDGGKIHVRYGEQDGALAIAIEDNGKGMSEETQKHIFEPFYSTKKDKGTGLGMFITYGIVRRLGGSIAIQSCEGQGTTAHLTLPLTPQKNEG